MILIVCEDCETGSREPKPVQKEFPQPYLAVCASTKLAGTLFGCIVSVTARS